MFGRLSSILIVGVLISYLGWTAAFAQIIGVEEGLCERIPVDPVTGERILYCCLDELFVMQQESDQGSIDRLTQALLIVRISGSADDVFFREPYESPFHKQYGWDTPCGVPVSCEKCIAGPVCGNGVVQEGEECDDGNSDDGDGCSWECNSETRIRRATLGCGDGFLAYNEECDDGNKRDSDGCSAVCTIELLLCGNGTPDPGEQCDDGNTTDGDGCSAFCGIETICGDGTLDPGEECDDGNTTDGDGCSSSCEKEFRPAVKVYRGNGILDPDEECDDANDANDDGCSATCKVEVRPSAPEEPDEPEEQVIEQPSEVSEIPTVPDEIEVILPPEGMCGNSLLEEFEECDDGNRDNDDGCSALCRFEGIAHRGRCGNGLIEPPEECDDGNVRTGDACSDECLITYREESYCGNMYLETGEECDDGNIREGDGCNVRCELEEGVVAYCGDGIITDKEQCDDGNADSGDGCSQVCRIETAIVINNSECGNGILDPGEECDDGNKHDSDGCMDTCFYERGGRGDGIVQRARGEQCDPASAGAPCNRNARFIVPDCGNGQMDVLEECDQGMQNTIRPGAVCRPDCSRAACGDTIRDPGERCDDGNLVAGDGCGRFCQLEGSVLIASEQRTHRAAVPRAQLIPQFLLKLPTSSILSNTGPTALLFMAAAAAAGTGWMRRRR